MIRYLNTKFDNTTETLDQLDSDDFNSYQEFVKAKRFLANEYRLAGGFGAVYWSQLPCKN